MIVEDREIDIREQAKAAGYEVKQKTTSWKMGDPMIPLPTQPDDPWYVMTPVGRGAFARLRDFWFGPFATEEEAATDGLSEVLRSHARAMQLEENYEVHPDAQNHWRVSRSVDDRALAGPFDNPSAALDVAESLAKEHREGRELCALRQIEMRLERCNIPIALRGIALDSFTAKTAALKETLGVCRDYVRTFNGPSSRNLWFCGEAGRGKTSLACAVASALAIAGHQPLYVTVTEIIRSQDNDHSMSELRQPDLLVLDWFGIQATGDMKANRDQTDLLGAISGRAVATVLEARYADSRSTLLVADCDQAGLQRYFGSARFEKLLRRQIVQF